MVEKMVEMKASQMGFLLDKMWAVWMVAKMDGCLVVDWVDWRVAQLAALLVAPTVGVMEKLVSRTVESLVAEWVAVWVVELVVELAANWDNWRVGQMVVHLVTLVWM